jgi:hypothetical protein
MVDRSDFPDFILISTVASLSLSANLDHLWTASCKTRRWHQADTASSSRLLQNGITALNLPWSMSSIFGNGSKGDLVAHEKKTMSVDSLETV